MTPHREQSDPSACPEDQAGPPSARSRAAQPHAPQAQAPQKAELDGSNSPRREGQGVVHPSTPDDPETLRWIRDAQAGDRDAFEQLILRYQDRVWRRALYRLGDHDEAYDLAQEVFLTCFRKIGQFRGESKFWTWLGRIVDNHVKNRQAWLIRRGSGKTVSLDAPLAGDDEERTYDPPDPSPGPRRKVENREAMQALMGNLSRLSPDHREILLLRFADGLAYEEIAESLQLSLGTVKSRINRARAELRELMEDFL
ncbi:sigma-70 family RNA polymerase sigma factor [Candidatus Sumerlaeota bacterium]|nr:sigma-70 family RNA polymerase sigma factor [Candidatus Sumerlaeota bacterium]